MDIDLSKIKQFDWNKGNLDHIKNHNVTKEECEEAILNKHPSITKDDTHSQLEDRYRLYGQANNGRHLFMIVTIREDKIRVISARDQNKKELAEFKKTGGENL